MALIQLALGFVVLFAYLWHVNRGLSGIPPDAAKLCQKLWTKEEIRETYRKIQESPKDVLPSLKSKKGRRYIVAGGSGLVGGWIVQHLLMRGEDPAAIRILDVKEPTRPEVKQNGVQFVQTDVTDPTSVKKAFDTKWVSKDIANRPLTVFHTVGYILSNSRTPDFLPFFLKVNVEGTRNVLEAAKQAGATCFIATSSGSVGQKPPSYFPMPWQRWPTRIFQMLGNADPQDYNAPLEDYAACYAYSKARAEKIVRDADSKTTGFRTGCIRPGHAIYGHAVENPASLTWDYLNRGGSPTWISNMVANFVSAQNVSVGHLALEDTLLQSSPSMDVGGNAYLVTDPNPPLTYENLYNTLTLLAHPTTPTKFPPVPPILMLLMSYPIEWYTILQHRYLKSVLPPITGDLSMLQPAVFQICTLHLCYSDERAKKEIGYNAPISTQEGFCQAMLDWNQKVELRLGRNGKAG